MYTKLGSSYFEKLIHLATQDNTELTGVARNPKEDHTTNLGGSVVIDELQPWAGTRQYSIPSLDGGARAVQTYSSGPV